MKVVFKASGGEKAAAGGSVGGGAVSIRSPRGGTMFVYRQFRLYIDGPNPPFGAVVYTPPGTYVAPMEIGASLAQYPPHRTPRGKACNGRPQAGAGGGGGRGRGGGREGGGGRGRLAPTAPQSAQAVAERRDYNGILPPQAANHSVRPARSQLQ